MPVNLDKDLSVPVSLKKRRLPAVLIYGSEDTQHLAKTLWSHIAGQDVRFLTAATEKELLQEAPQSALIFIDIPDIDESRIALAGKLGARRDIVADVIAITAEPDIRQRLHILSQEFDAIYNREILDLPEFSSVFRYKLGKGIRRLEARLQEEEYEIFKSFLSTSADAFIIFDSENRIFFVSTHYHELYPASRDVFTRGAPVQKTFESVARELGIRLGDPRYDMIKSFWLSLRGQLELSLDDGRVFRLTAVALPEKRGTIVSTTDITDLRQQQQELAERRHNAEQALIREQEASRLQKQFISMVSHEFRTPLTIIDGNAQILEKRAILLPAEERSRRLHTIRSAVSRLVNMMEAVLSSNLIRTGKLDLNYEYFDLHELAETLCDEQRGLSKDHSITCDFKDFPAEVYLDKKVITLVLTNLISNAVKYTRDAPDIHLHGAIEQNRIVMRVSDNGVGIPENEVDRIFDRFFRATTATGAIGSGVGLSLVQELVHLHKGFVHVESTIGKGTVFEIRLPVLKEESLEPCLNPS